MGKKNFKKISLIASVILTPIAITSSVVPLTISFSHNNKNNVSLDSKDLVSKNFKYLYNNKYYDSIDDISQELLVNNGLITNGLYYGDLNDAIFDQEYKRLDINRLRKYNPNRILPAYITSNGDYESDFNKAKKTFINQGLVRYYYLDNEGKLHFEFDDAKQSNINNIKVDELVYYKVKDINGNEIKINPLNNEDINLFKKITFEWLKSDKASQSDFSLKIFSKDTNTKSNEEKYTLNQDLTSFISNGKNQDNILVNINEKINDLLCNPNAEEKYDFRLSLNGMVNDYKFQWWKDDAGNSYDKWSKNNVEKNDTQYIEISDDKSLIFRNFRIREIEGLLNKFSSRENFTSLNSYLVKNEIKTWGQYVPPFFYNDEAEEAYWKIELGNNKYWIHLNYIGNHLSLEPKIDYKILQNGSRNNGVGFDVELIDKGKSSSIYSYKNDENNIYLNNIYENLKQNVSIEEFVKDKEIANEIISIFFKQNEKILRDLIYEKFFESSASYFYKKSAKKNKWKFDDEFEINKLQNQKFKYGIYFNENEKIRNILFDLIYETLKNKKDLKLIIFYKDYPILECDKNLLENPIDNSILNENNLSTYLKKNLLNLNIQNNDYSLIENISNQNNLTKTSFVKNDNFIFSINNINKMINVPKDKLSLNGKLNELNIDDESKYGSLWYALNAYNKNLERYIKRNGSTQNIENKLIKNNNVLFLRNGDGDINVDHSSQHLYYANYLGLKNDFNESVNDLQSTKFAYNQFSLKKLKEAASSINPSKVVILYNVVGEVMNPGVVLDEEMVINTSSDALYDLEQNLLDNVMRTLLIQKAEDKFFYLNDDGTKTLVKNKVNQIYTLTWKGVEYYFPTFENAKRYLNSILEILATKVEV